MRQACVPVKRPSPGGKGLMSPHTRLCRHLDQWPNQGVAEDMLVQPLSRMAPIGYDAPSVVRSVILVASLQVTTSKERKDNETPVSMLGCENSSRFNIRLYPPWLSLRWTEF